MNGKLIVFSKVITDPAMKHAIPCTHDGKTVGDVWFETYIRKVDSVETDKDAVEVLINIGVATITKDVFDTCFCNKDILPVILGKRKGLLYKMCYDIPCNTNGWIYYNIHRDFNK